MNNFSPNLESVDTSNTFASLDNENNTEEEDYSTDDQEDKSDGESMLDNMNDVRDCSEIFQDVTLLSIPEVSEGSPCRKECNYTPDEVEEEPSHPEFVPLILLQNQRKSTGEPIHLPVNDLNTSELHGIKELEDDLVSSKSDNSRNEDSPESLTSGEQVMDRIFREKNL